MVAFLLCRSKVGSRVRRRAFELQRIEKAAVHVVRGFVVPADGDHDRVLVCEPDRKHPVRAVELTAADVLDTSPLRR